MKLTTTMHNFIKNLQEDSARDDSFVRSFGIDTSRQALLWNTVRLNYIAKDLESKGAIDEVDKALNAIEETMSECFQDIVKPKLVLVVETLTLEVKKHLLVFGKSSEEIVFVKQHLAQSPTSLVEIVCQSIYDQHKELFCAAELRDCK